MALDKATVARVATLARIRLDDTEQERMLDELQPILGWIEQLGEVDTDGVEPMASVVAHSGKLRADVVTEPEQREKVLANAPETMAGFFVVPKVIE